MPDGRRLMASQIIHDDDVAGLQNGDELLLRLHGVAPAPSCDVRPSCQMQPSLSLGGVATSSPPPKPKCRTFWRPTGGSHHSKPPKRSSRQRSVTAPLSAMAFTMAISCVMKRYETCPCVSRIAPLHFQRTSITAVLRPSGTELRNIPVCHYFLSRM